MLDVMLLPWLVIAGLAVGHENEQGKGSPKIEEVMAKMGALI